MKKEKTIRTYQRRTKTGKVVTVKQHTAKYDAAEALKEAAKKKGAGDELEGVKKKGELDLAKIDAFKGDPKELSDKERQAWQILTGNYPAEAESKLRKMKSLEKVWAYADAKSKKKSSTKAPKETKVSKNATDPYSSHGFTKDEFKEWYEGTGSKADKKVEKALKKAMGTKAYNALSDKAADEYKKGGAHRFFTKGLEEMKASTSTSTKSVTPSKETKGSKETLVEHYDQFNTKYQGKAVGKPFQFKEKGTGITYDAQFVTDGRGKYGYVVRDSEDSDKRFYVSTDEATKLSELEPGVRKAAKAAGLTLKKGVWTSVSSKDAKTSKSDKKADSSEYGKAPKHLGMTQQEWNDWMDGGKGYAKADKKAKAHLEKLYGKDGAKAIRKKYEGDGSNKYIDLVSKATADKNLLSEIGGDSKSKGSELSGEKVGSGIAFKDNKAGQSWAKKNGEHFKHLDRDYYKVGDDVYGNITGGHGGTIWGKLNKSWAKRVIKDSQSEAQRAKWKKEPEVPSTGAGKAHLYKMLTSSTKLWDVPDKYKAYYTAYGNLSPKGKAFVKEYEASKKKK